MKKYKQSGITLIALVITIIVLLILAGISIAMITGQNGILTNAQKAAEETKKAENLEQEKLEELEEISESPDGNYIRNDDLEENNYLKSFITEWTVEANEQIILPIYEKEEEDYERGEKETYFNYNFTVDYGDGTVVEVTSFDDEDRMHTYKEAGTYKVKIDGLCESWSFYHINDMENRAKITKLAQWGVIGAKHYDFAGCVNLEGEIVLPSRNSFNEVESFRMLFYKCEKLTGKIPSNLFKYATKVKTMANVFNYTTGLTSTIPEDLFFNCKEVTNFRFVFAGSSVSGEIPENIFKENTKVNNFQGCFRECYNLEGDLPKYIFSYSNFVENLSVTIQLTNIHTNEIYINSPIIDYFEDNSFLSNLQPDEMLTIYVPSNSLTLQTIQNSMQYEERVKIVEI